ncbi:MAG: AraC family transcriptional regulator [Phycisphaerales bacterium]
MLTPNLLQTLRLSILNIDYLEVGQEWNYTNVKGPYYRLYLIVDGECSIYHNGKHFFLGLGTLHLVPGFTLSSYVCKFKMRHYYVYFSAQMDSGLRIFTQNDYDFSTVATDFDRILFARLLELNPSKELQNHDPDKYDKKNHLISAQNPGLGQNLADFVESDSILKLLLSRFLRNPVFAVTEKLDISQRLQTVTNYIDEHLNESLTLEILSELVFLTPDYFSKLFFKIMGVRPIEYINRKRIEHAQLLLLTTSHTLDMIAEKVGFSSASHFNMLFTRYSSVSPGEYRENYFK